MQLFWLSLVFLIVFTFLLQVYSLSSSFPELSLHDSFLQFNHCHTFQASSPIHLKTQTLHRKFLPSHFREHRTRRGAPPSPLRYTSVTQLWPRMILLAWILNERRSRERGVAERARGSLTPQLMSRHSAGTCWKLPEWKSPSAVSSTPNPDESGARIFASALFLCFR